MAEALTDGNLYTYYVATIADTSAPTVAEIGAGTKLSAEHKVDDLDIQFTENTVANDNAESDFDGTKVGTYGVNTIGITLDDDDARGNFDTLSRGLTGYLVVSRFGEPEASSSVEVYPVECHGAKPAPSVKNDKVKFTANFECTGAPELNATVAS